MGEKMGSWTRNRRPHCHHVLRFYAHARQIVCVPVLHMAPSSTSQPEKGQRWTDHGDFDRIAYCVGYRPWQERRLLEVFRGKEYQVLLDIPCCSLMLLHRVNGKPFAWFSESCRHPKVIRVKHVSFGSRRTHYFFRADNVCTSRRVTRATCDRKVFAAHEKTLIFNRLHPTCHVAQWLACELQLRCYLLLVLLR